MITDSHCHIHLLPDYPQCVNDVLKAGEQAGIQYYLNVCTTLDELPELHKLAEHEKIYISVGVHPNEAPGAIIERQTLVDAVESHPKIIAIGETGLDTYRHEPDADLSWQKDRFAMHIDVAKTYNKPLIIHMRDAVDDTLAILTSEKASDVGGVMHCFTENWDVAKRALDIGFYISLSGIVTFKNAKAVQEVAQNVPLDKLLIETDCPYLAPVPFRGKTNQPAYVSYVADFIAALRGMDSDEIKRQTTENFEQLFMC